MDAAVLAEWSRFLVGGAIAAFIVAWLAYCADAAQRVRARRAATQRIREQVAVGPADTGIDTVLEGPDRNDPDRSGTQMAAIGHS
ncbi:MAG TPA: hypothetical protein VFI46_14385, partial [Jiangellaceae bacterium]|nr:hypothetical protein [Jiangellaceae bacterium]